MKLSEALALLHRQQQDNPPFPVTLICGFTPDPLLTFLKAHLQSRLPQHRVVGKEGCFGDILGNLERYHADPSGPAALVLEWADLDSRLGWRQHAGWGRRQVDSICGVVERQLGQIRDLLSRTSGTVAISLPTLPAAPVEPVPGWQYGELQLRLDELAATFARSVSTLSNVRLINPHRLALLSPADKRVDVKTVSQAGSPYQLPHADALAGLLALTLSPPSPLKGIITDLDNTLWSGILGDLGVEGVAWHLDQHAAQHGVFQQVLQSLADSGVLIAIASKNDDALVRNALERKDLLLRPGSVFPVEANWGPKSESIRKILAAWNVGADSVVFIDDSPMELAEVRSVHPSMECITFSPDPNQVAALASRLNDLFGKHHDSAEDALRLSSIRSRVLIETAPGGDGAVEHVLATSDGVLTITRLTDPPDPRALELVNKTNQFNLNGQRFNEMEWLDYLRKPGNSIWLASYTDQFGPLGKISVLAGSTGDDLVVDSWVLSCRAFGRRIEFALLQTLLAESPSGQILLNFKPTDRNGPIQDLLKRVADGSDVPRITSATLEQGKQPWFLRVEY